MAEMMVAKLVARRVGAKVGRTVVMMVEGRAAMKVEH